MTIKGVLPLGHLKLQMPAESMEPALNPRFCFETLVLVFQQTSEVSNARKGEHRRESSGLWWLKSILDIDARSKSGHWQKNLS